MHHRSVPLVPPLPLFTRSSRGTAGGSRHSGGRSRSRSRSRSPSRGGGSSSRYTSRNERDSRDTRERERSDRDRGRRRSPSPYCSKGGGRSKSSHSESRSSERDRKPSTSVSKPSLTASNLDNIPAVSMIRSKSPPAIIRRILNPEEVKIPRRVNEGSKPIFDREELLEAIAQRMKTDDNEENPSQHNSYIQEAAVTQQRVVAIIREPVGSSLESYLAAKEASFQNTLKLSASNSQNERVSPDNRRPSFDRRSPSPRTTRKVSSGNSSNRRHSSRSPPLSSSRARSLERERREHEIRELQQQEREREILEREKALEREREELNRERQLQRSAREHLPHILPGRGRDLHERDHHPRHDLRAERNTRREDKSPPRFVNESLPIRPRMEVSTREATFRSRSPVTRVPREDIRGPHRRSRSHSVTPPPMPDNFRRQLIMERQKQIDLRNSLSRQPAKLDVRIRGRPGTIIPRGGSRGGRGGFLSRSRGRGERRAWLHDMYDEEEAPKKG